MQNIVYPHVAEILRRYNRPKNIVIEVGCGGSQYSEFLEGRHIGIDLPNTSYASRGIDPNVYGDGQALPFKSESADIVFMVGVLYQIPDATAALEECYRVLKRGGRLVVFDYNLVSTARLKKLEYNGNNQNNIWSPWGLSAQFRRAGFHAQIIWDYSKKNSMPLMQFLKRVKSLRFLIFLIDQFREDWNVVIGTR
jgi:ubiquinone/menaquinone biosynthesis C-methylase UbiE